MLLVYQRDVVIRNKMCVPPSGKKLNKSLRYWCINIETAKMIKMTI